MSALATVLLAAGILPVPELGTPGGSVPVGVPTVRLDAPTIFIEGQPFPVKLSVEAPEDGAPFASWLITPAAFSIDGVAVAQREAVGTLTLPRGAKLTVEYDLGTYLLDSSAYERRNFQLGYAEGVVEVEPIPIQCFEPAPGGIEFMTLEAEKLAAHRVLFVTELGDMHLEVWPDVAPQHVRNFLDLCYVGFYDGTGFHRVKPGFMIQGGDPTGTGAGSGPRKVPAEFSDRKHVRGVLSMARGADRDSASSQFFVVHAATPSLDGQYSAFGELVHGFDTLDRIANARGRQSTDGTVRPTPPPHVVRALVLRPLGEQRR